MSKISFDSLRFLSTLFWKLAQLGTVACPLHACLREIFLETGSAQNLVVSRQASFVRPSNLFGEEQEVDSVLGSWKRKGRVGRKDGGR
jgi:hypothetical protein